MRRYLAAAISLTLGSLMLVSAAQANTLYVTDGDESRLALVDITSGTLIGTYTTSGGQYPIAVGSSVWLGNYYGSNASQYNLDGSATGTTAPSAVVSAVDGTTDGTYNYELGGAFSEQGTIYRTNADFTSPVSLFNTASGQDFVGITYDSKNNTLFVSDDTTVYQYAMDGTLLSQFAKTDDRGSLAYDPTTDSLWFVINGSDTIQQFSTTGTLLQTEDIAGLSSNNWGAEFALGSVGPQTVPEPTTLAILSVAIPAAGFVRRNRPRV